MAENAGKIDLSREGLRGRPPGCVPEAGGAGHKDPVRPLGAGARLTPATAYLPVGTVDGKVIDTRMARQMSFSARWGSSCGTAFDAAKFLAEHPQFDWTRDILLSRPSHPWTDSARGSSEPSSSSSWPEAATQGAPSSSSRARLAASPPPKPVSEPSAPTTRWQGTTIGSGLRRSRRRPRGSPGAEARGELAVADGGPVRDRGRAPASGGWNGVPSGASARSKRGAAGEVLGELAGDRAGRRTRRASRPGRARGARPDRKWISRSPASSAATSSGPTGARSRVAHRKSPLAPRRLGGDAATAPEVEHRVTAPRPPGLRRAASARGVKARRPRRRPGAGRGRRPGTRRARRARAGRRTAPSSLRSPAAHERRARPRPWPRAGRPPVGDRAGERPQRARPGGGQAQPGEVGAADRGGRGKGASRPSRRSRELAPTRATSRPASVRPAATVTCWPRIARTATRTRPTRRARAGRGAGGRSGSSSGSGASAARSGRVGVEIEQRGPRRPGGRARRGRVGTCRLRRVPARRRADAHHDGPGAAPAGGRSPSRRRARRPGSPASRGRRAGRPRRTAAGRRGGSTISPRRRAGRAGTRRSALGEWPQVVAERVVEAAQAAEARRERDLRHRQRRSRRAVASRSGRGASAPPRGRDAEVRREEPAQMAGADAEPRGELVDAAVVERAGVDQAQRPPDGGRGAQPGGRARRRLRPAAQAGPEARLLRGGGAGRSAGALRAASRRADRSAVDAGGS